MTVSRRMKKAFNLVKEGEPVSKALLKAGYKPSVARVPKNVTKTVGWKDLMERELPDEFLARVHKEGLKATKKEVGNLDAPDFAVRHKYLETAYKIKNKIPKENNIGVAVQVNVDKIRDEYE